MRRASALAVPLTVLAVAACDPPRDAAPAPSPPSTRPLPPMPLPAPSRAASVVTPGMGQEARAFYEARADEFAEERLAAAETQGRVTRRGGVLALRLESGRTVTLADSIVEGDDFRRHLYRGWLRTLGVHVVEVGYYEEVVYSVYHDATGTQVEVPGLPVASPDGARFAVASADLHAGYAPNVLQVWRVGPRGIEREWALDGGDAWGPTELAWDGFTRLRYQEERLTPAADGGEDTSRTPAALVLVDGRWSVER